MTPSDRIKYIKEIGERLSRENWDLIHLTLDQFGVKDLKSFSGTAPEYVIKRVQNADDKQLTELATHLDIGVAIPEPQIVPSFWKPQNLRLFISHISSSKMDAQSLKEKLDQYSICGFVAHSDIEPSKEWQNEIEMAIRTADVLVALITPDFHNSKWTDQEVGIAIGRDLVIIPVRIGSDPYGFIAKYQAITFRDGDQTAVDIFESLLGNSNTRTQLSSCVLHRFETSRSFADAKTNFALVSKIKLWDEGMLERLGNSVKNNSQISGCFGLPSRVNFLLSQHTSTVD